MAFGLDFAWSKPSITAMHSGGYSFVARYLSYDTTGKNLTLNEANGYKAASPPLAIVSNWEYSATAAMNGYNQGAADARAALAQHNAAGGDSKAPIYFSVDWDVTDAQKPVVGQYMKGVASVLSLARTGAYGSYWVIKYLFDNKLITWGWQTYAWSGGLWDTRAQIRQVANGISVGNADCDRNQSMVDNFGQWNATQEGFLMALSDEQQQTLYTMVSKIGAADGGYTLTKIINAATTAGNQATAQAKAAADAVADLGAKVDDLAGKVGQTVSPAIDYNALASAILQAIRNGA